MHNEDHGPKKVFTHLHCQDLGPLNDSRGQNIQCAYWIENVEYIDFGSKTGKYRLWVNNVEIIDFG